MAKKIEKKPVEKKAAKKVTKKETKAAPKTKKVKVAKNAKLVYHPNKTELLTYNVGDYYISIKLHPQQIWTKKVDEKGNPYLERGGVIITLPQTDLTKIFSVKS